MVERAVLVTRPREQAAALCRLVQEAGFRAIAQPMIEIKPLSELGPRQLQMVMDLDHYQHVILVSSNAVQWGMEWINQFWPQLPLGLEWYAIGKATAGKLSSYGVAVRQPETEMNSEGLLALTSLQAVADDRVLIIKGEGGRKQLSDVLSKRGARVEQLSVYRRVLPPISGTELTAVLNENQFAAIVATSGEGLHNMLSLLSPGELQVLRGIPLIVPGQRVAELADDSGFRAVYTARNATDKAIIEALRECVGSEENGGQN
ncbi:MAG: uroporphyrinogen-III synthase [Gammaproteobacteria bacterium]|nr:uroporphyrinogen-III synthase [Gammaproteobacteria bacterium]